MSRHTQCHAIRDMAESSYAPCESEDTQDELTEERQFVR